MSDKFPHISDTDFPHLNTVDVYAIKTSFDYTRWDIETKLKLCNVNWCGDYDNVVKFDDDESRDEYFTNLTGDTITLTESCRIFDENEIKLPIPYDVINKYNYVCVEYPVVTSEGNKIDYETVSGKRKYFYFILSCDYSAPNCTHVYLQLDTWTTYINDIDINYCVLERGHAPMAEVTPDQYLANPLENSKYLLSSDVNYGEASIVKDDESIVLNNGNMLICFATTSNPKGAWGTKSNSDWTVPTSVHIETQGLPNNVFVFGISINEYNTFITDLTANAPQFLQTVQGVFLISESLVTKETPFKFSFTTVTCYPLTAAPKSLDSITLDKSMFGFDSKYSNKLAKLYTFPYSYIEITDGSKIAKVKIEDTTGTININSLTSLAFPFINIELLLNGIGGSNTKTLSFKNLTERSFTYQGKWYDFNDLKIDIPIYTVLQSSSSNYDFSTYYDRAQQTASLNLSETQSYAQGDLNNSNTSIATTAARANQTTNNTASTTITTRNNTLLEDNRVRDQNYMNACYNANISNESQSAIMNSVATVAGAAVSIGVLVLAKNPMAAAAAGSSVAGALVAGTTAAIAGSVANAGIQAATTGVSYNISTTKEYGILSASVQQAGFKTDNTKDANSDNTATSNAAATTCTNRSCTAQEDQMAATVTLSKTQATQTKNLGLDGITRSIQQAGLAAPIRYGESRGFEESANKPQALYFNIVTEKDGEIAQAGDQMLRYGYMLNQAWNFEGFNVMDNFSYWKMSDLWLNGSTGVIENAQQTIKDILVKGVTVWSDPDKIGNISIYDN